VFGKMFDPAPGLPGMFAGDAPALALTHAHPDHQGSGR
jgi:hypothetical protein